MGLIRLNSDAYGSVSYTHLDVYKRQAMQHLCSGSLAGTLSLQELPDMSRVGKVFRVASN